MHKQDEIDMTNMEPNATVANATLFNHSHCGFHWVDSDSCWADLDSCLGFLDTNMLISATRNVGASRWVRIPTRSPNANEFAFWWNIGFRPPSSRKLFPVRRKASPVGWKLFPPFSSCGSIQLCKGPAINYE